MTQTIPAKKNFFNQNVDLMNGPIFKSLFKNAHQYPSFERSTVRGQLRPS